MSDAPSPLGLLITRIHGAVLEYARHEPAESVHSGVASALTTELAEVIASMECASCRGNLQPKILEVPVAPVLRALLDKDTRPLILREDFSNRDRMGTRKINWLRMIFKRHFDPRPRR